LADTIPVRARFGTYLLGVPIVEEPSVEMVSIIMPVYNEPAAGRVAEEALSMMEELGRPYEILVIDDGSDEDVGGSMPTSPCLRTIRFRTNRGYGACLKEGICQASGGIVLTMDADGQHRASDIPRILAAIDDGAEVAMGSRQAILHSRLWRLPGKWLLKKLAGYLVGRKIPDVNCGFRAFRTEVIRPHLHLCPNGFSFSTTSTLVMISERRDVEFVPLDVDKRTGRSTVGIDDGFKTMLGVLRIIMLFSPLRVLLPPSMLCLLLGAGMLVYNLIHTDISDATILLIVGGMLLFFFGLLADQVAALRRDRSD
jgi:glycosyltransferase involved in cell wall biosynthesis